MRSARSRSISEVRRCSERSVEDFASAIDVVLERGEAGQVYNVGGPDEKANIEVVKRILELAGRDESLITYVSDRLGHDRRQAEAAVTRILQREGMVLGERRAQQAP